MWNDNRGFTIVELLIVIVVIAILAAITVVAYNGLQTRAENTKTINATAAFVRAIHGYAASYGTYPVEAGYPCLADSGVTCGKVSGATACSNVGITNSNVAYVTELKKILASIPQFSSQQISCNGNKVVGAWVEPSTGKNLKLRYTLRGDQACGAIGGIASFSKTQLDDLTICDANFVTLP